MKAKLTILKKKPEDLLALQGGSYRAVFLVCRLPVGSRFLGVYPLKSVFSALGVDLGSEPCFPVLSPQGVEQEELNVIILADTGSDIDLSIHDYLGIHDVGGVMYGFFKQNNDAWAQESIPPSVFSLTVEEYKKYYEENKEVAVIELVPHRPTDTVLGRVIAQAQKGKTDE